MQKLSSEIKIDQLATKLSACENLLYESRQENDAFINLAAHDLKAPLRKLSTLIDRLLLKSKKIEGPNLDLYTEKILKTISDMNILVDDLSAYAAVETEEIKFTETSLTALVKEVLEEEAEIINRNAVMVSMADLPSLKINKVQVKWVFKELLVNAIKFKSEARNIHIEIKSYLLSSKEKEEYNLDEDNIYHKIEFIDNGIGIEKSVSEKIFQPFFRYHGKAAFAGSGMGLAISRKIMKNHHGLIYSVPNEYEGVRMIVIFPETF